MGMNNPASNRRPKSSQKDQEMRFNSEWVNAVDAAGHDFQDISSARIGDSSVEDLTASVFGNSPYLAKICVSHPDYIKKLASSDPSDLWKQTLANLLSEIKAQPADVPAVGRLLRKYKKIASLHVALCDIADIWSLDDVVSALSEFADICVSAALNILIRIETEKGELRSASNNYPAVDSGVFVLGLGKLGANELNYSSDIDLMFLFDRDKIPYEGKKSPQEFAIRVAKALVKLLDDRTSDGYVFRVDMRLRPDPGSTPVAVSTEAAEQYYESWGQNWERAALLKARVIAGDQQTGQAFLDSLAPFIWRKSLDFYAIQDIHSVKRQIYATKGGANIDVLGHDVKTGRGGIREIEFFVQIQQLIWGGRNPNLRAKRTLDALVSLHSEELIAMETVEDLSKCYEYLRRVEHRLQMINDEQTQRIPNDPEKAAQLALFLGYSDLEEFESAVKDHLKTVEFHYADLFEDSPDLAVEGNLVFTGTDHDTDTLQTLQSMGFENPTAASDIIRSWHQGKMRATRSVRARQILTEITPSLLLAFAATDQPDRALLTLDQTLSKLPAGIQLFSIFYSNPEVLDFIAEIMGVAPRLASLIAQAPQRIDYVLEPEFFDSFPPPEELAINLSDALNRNSEFEMKLECCVRWTNDMRFRTSILVLRGSMTPLDGSAALTVITEIALQSLVDLIRSDFESRYGVVENSGFAILAYGKLGSGELMPGSDLDLVFVYDAKTDAKSKNGERSLPTAPYFIKLGQRIVSTLTAMTPEGRLFEVDLRLRPSGDQGPLASSLESLAQYQASEAWTWEHLALTRARVVYATKDLRTRINSIILQTIKQQHELSKVKTDIAKMRDRISKEQPPQNDWDLKRLRGGLSDTEFVIQYHALTSGLTNLNVNTNRTVRTIHTLVEQGTLSGADGALLTGAFTLWINVIWMLRHCIEQFDPKTEIPVGLMKAILRVTGMKDETKLRQEIIEKSHSIDALLHRTLETE